MFQAGGTCPKLTPMDRPLSPSCKLYRAGSRRATQRRRNRRWPSFGFPLISPPRLNNMRSLAFALLFSVTIVPLCTRAQEDNGEVRVSVVLNADGSRTVYESNAANHKTVATTTGKDGKVREKIRYELDENGRFTRAEVLGPKDQFRFFAQYKYDGTNHLIEEIHFAKDQSVIGKIVFRYDAAGHQIGYSTYDGAGKLLGQTAAPTASPAKRR